MPRRILDTNILINFWGDQTKGRKSKDIAPRDARKWAKQLVKLQATNGVLTPIYIEYICGQSTAHETKLAREFLDEFEIVDEGKILDQDWEDAKRIAQRIFRDGKRRQLGDCLIRAICNRLRLDVLTVDRRFPN